MGDNSKIDWTNATWEPVQGCTPVSWGCDNCYGKRLADGRMKRFYPEDFNKVILRPDQLDKPLHWRKPRMIFVCSRSDLFHSQVPWDFIDDVFTEIVLGSQHTFQILTKRPGRMAWYFTKLQEDIRDWPLPIAKGSHRIRLVTILISLRREWPLPNIWAGTSVESLKYLPRLDVLARVPAKVRFVSLEPLLEPVSIKPWLGAPNINNDEYPPEDPMLQWVIVGGESGPHARPMNPEWVRKVRDDCQAAGVPFYLKQWGGRKPGGPAFLDGVEHREFPP